LKTNKIIFETLIAVAVTVTSFALNGTRTTTTTKAASSSNNKIFYLFSAEIEGVDEEKLSSSDDVYSLPTMVVNKGDTVTVHFYNLEKDTRERYSFTIEAPYNINKDLAGGQNVEATFTADHEDIFQYFDKYHPQIMTGQLVLLVVLSKDKLKVEPN
jgi:plastocyanin